MKITHICLSGLYMDGWGYQDNMLAKYHKKAGHDTSVIANEFMYDHEGNYVKIDGVKYMQPDIDENGVRVYRLPAKGDPILTGPAQRVHYEGLFDVLLQIAPDVIFLHNPQILDVEEIIKYMKKNPAAKLFVDSHSDYSNSGRNFLSKHILHGMLWRGKIQKLVPYTEKFFGVLPARVDFLLERYHTPKEKTELLVMGMDDDLAEAAASKECQNATREKLNISPEDFCIVSGGKIDGAKWQTLLLMEAVHAIDNPHLKLVVFGSVTEDIKPRFEEALKKDERIQYIGWVKANDTYPYFAAADLVIFPGRHSVMWEQVAGQGIPMLVKYWAGTTHVDLGGNVHLLQEDSALEIRKEIESLMDRGEKYQNMKENAAKGREVFSYRAISERAIN